MIILPVKPAIGYSLGALQQIYVGFKMSSLFTSYQDEPTHKGVLAKKWEDLDNKYCWQFKLSKEYAEKGLTVTFGHGTKFGPENMQVLIKNTNLPVYFFQQQNSMVSDKVFIKPDLEIGEFGISKID